MDSQSRNKAYRAKLNALKKEKRIESPLVRYNESGQPVCRVCELVLKSNSHWDVHQASRKHNEAITALKANAAGLTQPRPTNKSTITNSEPDLHISRLEPRKELDQNATHIASETLKLTGSSGLPPNFFDNDPKEEASTGGYNNTQASDSIRIEDDSTKAPPVIKPGKGSLPAGFFDNKDADLRARGIKPVKPDVKDEYKEFEKLIQEDLQEVDNRLEEEEIDAAEMIEEAESVEQKTYQERVEILRKKKLELKATRSAKRSKTSEEVTKDPIMEESSSDEDTVENFAVDWRAQHL